jgi:hypothetical protein
MPLSARRFRRLRSSEAVGNDSILCYVASQDNLLSAMHHCTQRRSTGRNVFPAA